MHHEAFTKWRKCQNQFILVEIKICWHNWLKRNVGFEGKIIFAVHFQIQPWREFYLSKLSTYFAFSFSCFKLKQSKIGLGSKIGNRSLDCLEVFRILKTIPRSMPCDLGFSCVFVFVFVFVCVYVWAGFVVYFVWMGIYTVFCGSLGPCLSLCLCSCICIFIRFLSDPSPIIGNACH